MSDLDLASVIARRAERAATPPTVLLVGTVASTTPLRVDAGGVTVAAERLTSYAAAAADTVLVARLGTRFIVLGKVV